MANTFTAQTPFGLVLGTLTDVAGTVHFDEFKIDKNLTITITINDPYFEDPTIVDYRISQLVTAIQEDFLGIYNKITGDNVTLSSLRNHPQLVIQAKLKKGSLITEISGAIRAVDDLMKHFAMPEHKIKALRLALGIFALGCGTYLGGKYLDYLSTVKIEDTKFAIRQLELANKRSPIINEAVSTARDNNKTANTIAGLISDTGTVKIGDSPAITGQELRFKIQHNKPEEQSIEAIPFILDGVYKIDCQNYDDQTIRIKINNKTVWASTASLRPNHREELKSITDAAVDQKKAQRAYLQISVEIVEGKIKNAKIEGIGKPRPSAISVHEALALAETQNPKTTAIPLPLLPN